ncbi:transcription factor, contains a PHD finger motif [Coemansia thaxteri]|uniref:Transcription factor, contains a PHD finger motif n=1 Tax=Coemansia thaxteri TaxID=2663907 RepID=A0A9W8BG87_9FUNG|nr:transcription factor, contains a PHD finger motif [Coemansia thaxteri]KAJ2484655.1 transcription factor, contains a PHD finger motif [Coemansia sp. RSA 2320]
MAVDNSSENGDDIISKDKLLPKVKQVSKCSYCESNSAESLKTVPCLGCGSRCHIDCIECTSKFKDKILLGDDFFHFKCLKCTDGQERFKRYHLSWVDVVHITLFNLTHNPNVRPNSAASRARADDPMGQFSSGEHGPQEYSDSRVYFHYKADVAKFIDQHWSYFWTKSRGETWVNSASSALSTNSTENVPEDGRFESGKAKYNKNGMWALTDDLRFPSSYDSPQQQKTRTIMYSFAEDGALIELRTQSANGRRKRRPEPTPKAGVRAKKPRASGTPGSMASGSQGSGILGTQLGGEYGSGASGLESSKRGSHGKGKSKNAWWISMWPDIDNPQGPAHMSREETHAAAQFVIESDRLTVWNDKAYRMAKASHGVETGAWYFEVDVLEPVRPEYNLRIGWSQISGELQAPCGYDVFSYSVRAKPSTRFHAAIGSPYGEEYTPGDTLGMLIYLPTLDDDEKQDLIDRKWQPARRYRPFEYSRPESQRPRNAYNELPPMPVLAGSELVYFKNGKCLGPAFQKLYLGKYYPAISSYMGGKVKVNLGPTFKYPPPATWHKDMSVRPISDLEFTLPPPAQPEAEKAAEEQQSSVKSELPPEAEAALTTANGVSAPAETTLAAQEEPIQAPPVDSATVAPDAIQNDLLLPVVAEAAAEVASDSVSVEQAELLQGLSSASLDAAPFDSQLASEPMDVEPPAPNTTVDIAATASTSSDMQPPVPSSTSQSATINPD